MQKHGFAEADGEAILSAMNAMLLASEMPAHPDDPTLQSEHMAAMDLAKPEEATHVATASGDWSSASTWQGGRIPDQGSRVLIPEAHSVTLDRELASELEWLRLNGELRFATDRDTELSVDTLSLPLVVDWRSARRNNRFSRMCKRGSCSPIVGL